MTKMEIIFQQGELWMNRIVMMLSRNITKLPGLFYKLNHYAKHTDAYPEQEKYDHIRYMFQLALEK